MVGYVRALLGLTVCGLAVGLALSVYVVNGAALTAQAQRLAAAAFGVGKPLPPVLPPVAAPIAVPAATPASPPLQAPVPTSLSVPQAVAPVRVPAMPVVVYPNGTTRGDQAVATRGRDGHFYFDTTMNGATVRMLFDTGATVISLRAEDAAKAGINLASLRYSVSVMTANGKADAAPVVIASLTVGDITRRNVSAHVARPGAMSINLLGQSFMSRIAGYKVDGERLILQGGD